MSLSDSPRSYATDWRSDSPTVGLVSASRTVPAVVGLMAALLVAGFVATSSLMAVLPEFDYESQLPALLPLFLWGAAAGVSHLANLARSLARPWRQAYGIWALIPYAGLILLSAAMPDVVLPWWLAALVAVVAAMPFVVVAARAPVTLVVSPSRRPDDESRRGTFLVAIAVLLMAYAVTQSSMLMATVGVLLAVALAVASLMPNGLARASRTWQLAHWICLAWGTLLIWASALLRGMTSFFDDPWFVLTVVVLAPLPLLVLNGRDARVERPPTPDAP